MSNFFLDREAACIWFMIKYSAERKQKQDIRCVRAVPIEKFSRFRKYKVMKNTYRFCP